MARPTTRAPAPAPEPRGLSIASLIVMAAAVLGVVLLIVLTANKSEGAVREGEAAAACPAGEECVTLHTGAGAHVFTAEWAITPDQQQCGLMFREEMAEDHGMVFDFQVERPASFWMRNTLISLDIIFIRADGTVQNIAERTEPLSLAGIPSTGPVRYVLEVVAGTADRIGLAPGDRVELERATGMTEGTAICFPPPA